MIKAPKGAFAFSTVDKSLPAIPYFSNMNYILFDDSLSEHLLPLTYTRPSCELLVGIWRLREKWESRLGRSVSFIPYRNYLASKYPAHYTADNTYINGALLVDDHLYDAVNALGMQQALVQGNRVLAVRSANQMERFESELLDAAGIQSLTYENNADWIAYPEDIFHKNGRELARDFAAITANRHSAKADDSNRLIAQENIFIEEGATLTACTINAKAGPVYIAAGAEVMEGATIRGPFYLGEHSTVKMGAKIYGDTSIGPHCKVGGEITNSVMMGYSNKGHDGYMGNSVIGEWCNWGADTNNSNLKNNYEQVKLWDHVTGRFRNTGLQFAGLIMADHAKCGINTMFNTGTVVGVGANIFGAGFPRNFMPAFAWGGAQSLETFRFAKFCETAQKVMERRGLELNEQEKSILEAIYNETSSQRSWEKNN